MLPECLPAKLGILDIPIRTQNVDLVVDLKIRENELDILGGLIGKTAPPKTVPPPAPLVHPRVPDPRGPAVLVRASLHRVSLHLMPQQA